MNRLTLPFLLLITSVVTVASAVETLRQAPALEEQLKQTNVELLAKTARERGDSQRGAIIFYTSPAACVNCHASGTDASPLGPDLAQLGEISDTALIEALLTPSKSIRKGFATKTILTVDGQTQVGMIVSEDSESITVRMASDLGADRVIAKDDIEAIRTNTQSMMPEGLIASLREQRDFMDLARYIMDVAAGGKERAAELKPPPEILQPRDDTIDLDHAGIIKSFRKRDFEAGRAIYHGYCFNCHGNDGNTPSLPTARAFGTQKLRFGSDPYRMFLTLSKGNGLMAPMSHLTPLERYQVVHYVREQFMKPTNDDYSEINEAYLEGLPTGTRDGTEVPEIDRDYGPALASQLRRDFSSVLNIRLGDLAIAYDLHTMDQAAVWKGGFLDLSQTQHARDRGEGTADPEGSEIDALSGWRWAHDGALDYPTDELAPRGPMPAKWMDYYGHYRFGQAVVLSYAIDGRSILESPSAESIEFGSDSTSLHALVHRMQIDAGNELRLAVADGSKIDASEIKVIGPETEHAIGTRFSAGEATVVSRRFDEEGLGRFVATIVIGETDGLKWSIDKDQRVSLHIPGDKGRRNIEIVRFFGESEALIARVDAVKEERRQAFQRNELRTQTDGGPAIWPDVIETVGHLGLEDEGYALDTLTLPDATPWNTWFRTSALDFFPDGRMVVTTYGGDVWIVSGIDDELKSLRWKRFAGGLYEPFGVKVVDEFVYVTCKDRITRLHDLNEDGEADFYESFSADTDVSVNFHAFNFDLQTDHEGNFFYSKSGHGGDSEIPGQVVKVSRDGSQRELFSTGFRTPNGMGMLPDGRPTNSDNQGQWMPASKINLLKPGGFYGWVQTYSIPGMWAPGGGSIDLKKVVPPTSFDQPLVWMPQEFDNSSGGQLWVDDQRFGPLSGHLLHTSFGKGWMSYLMIQEIEGTSQAAIIKLPLDFRTGIMRARVNPKDGQVYATGLQGWNGGGRIGLRDSGIQRLRYTGTPAPMVTDCRVEKGGLRINLNVPVNEQSALDANAYSVNHWNYHWRREYGSDQYSPTTDQVGPEQLQVESVSLAADGRSILLRIPQLIPVDQLHLVMKIETASGAPFEEEIYWTIHKVPSE